MIDLELFKRLIKERLDRLNQHTQIHLRPPPNTDVVLEVSAVKLTSELHSTKWN